MYTTVTLACRQQHLLSKYTGVKAALWKNATVNRGTTFCDIFYIQIQVSTAVLFLSVTEQTHANYSAPYIDSSDHVGRGRGSFILR